MQANFNFLSASFGRVESRLLRRAPGQASRGGAAYHWQTNRIR